jgi:hypothetical protein
VRLCLANSEGQIHSIKTSNKFFASVAKFIYFGTTVMSQNLIHKVIKKRLNSGTACYLSF